MNQNGIDVFTDSFGFGGSIARNIAVTPGLDLIPAVSFTYITTEGTVKDNFGSSVSESDNSTVVSLALNFGIRNDSGNIFFVTPTISLNEGDTAFFLSLGYVFLTSKQKINSTPFSKPKAGEFEIQRQQPSHLRTTPPTETEREIVGKITKVIGNYAVVKLNPNTQVFEGMRLDVYEPEYLFDLNIPKVCSVNVFKVTTSQAALEIIENDNNGNLQVGQLVVMLNK